LVLRLKSIRITHSLLFKLQFKKCKVCSKKILLGILCGKCVETILISLYSGDANSIDIKKLITSLSGKTVEWQSPKSGSQ